MTYNFKVLVVSVQNKLFQIVILDLSNTYKNIAKLQFLCLLILSSKIHFFPGKKKLLLCSNKKWLNNLHCLSHLLRFFKTLITSRENGQKVWTFPVITQIFDLWSTPSQSHQNPVFIRFRNRINSWWWHKYILLNYGYAILDVFHSSLRRAVSLWRVDVHGQALTWQCLDYMFPKLLQQLSLLCVIQAAVHGPKSVMQRAKSHPCYSHQYSERFSICKMKESTVLLSCLAVKSQTCRSGLSPVKYKQLRQTRVPLNPSVPVWCHLVNR